MKTWGNVCLCGLTIILLWACGKKKDAGPPEPPPSFTFSFSSLRVDGGFNGFSYKNVNQSPVIRISFSTPIKRSSAESVVTLATQTGTAVNTTFSYDNADSTIIVRPASPLSYLSQYKLIVPNTLESQKGGTLQSAITVDLQTKIDSSYKFPLISDEQLLTKVQEQTFKYFWDFGHPVSGLARERNTSGDLVTSGGSGFGIMAIVTAVNRGFITRQQGLERMQTIVDFLKNKAQKFHGAFPHWMNGITGNVIPFSQRDNGADLVETSFLIQGLLTARQYFNNAGAAEMQLRADINGIWQGVEWSWFRRNNGNVLYWHWSPQNDWEINLPIRGWNECLITYVLAASSPSHSIPKTVYDEGWARSGAIRNNANYLGIPLPMGPDLGGPLFFSHYSFLGINPNGLVDTYANYEVQNKNHALINYTYCKNNPRQYFGYSDSCWGLTASDIKDGYTASSPTNDRSFIAPTAALSSFPYTPQQSMQALKFFYYVLGDKLWKEYGFIDSFSLDQLWFASSFLAIDQGPIICMIENYRSGLLWDLFMSCPEIQTGMKGLGFSGPNIN